MAHHPLFVRFGKAFQARRFDEALVLIDALDKLSPGAPQIAWHRARCLEALGRYDEIAAQLDRVLAKAPDYVPALLMRVRYTADGEAEPPTQGDASRSLSPELALRRVLGLQPDNVEALVLLSGLLRYREGEGAAAAREESAALLDRAIRLAPERIDLLETRANALREQAQREPPGLTLQALDEDCIEDAQGEVWHQPTLEYALADYERCFALDGHPRYAVSMGRLLLLLGREDAAIERLTEALSALPEGDPERVLVEDLLRRAAPPEADLPGAAEVVIDADEGGMPVASGPAAALAESTVSAELDDTSSEQGVSPATGPGEEALADPLGNEPEPLPETAADDAGVVAEAPPPWSQQARQPVVSDAVELSGDDPATAIALRVLEQAREPAPAIEEVDATRYPGYQRRYIERVQRSLEPLGIDYIGDAEAMGLRALRGRPVLTRFFADEDGEFGVAAHGLLPPWPGVAGFFRLLRAGRWKVEGHIECASRFDDGTYLMTRHDRGSPFSLGGRVQCESLPRETPIEALVQAHRERHAAYRAAHPEAAPMIAHDIEGMDLRWRAGQQARCAYRQSIGYLDEAELQALLGESDASLAHEVRKALVRLLDGAPRA